MKKLFEPFKLKNLPLKNRVVVPPMVCYTWVKEDGMVTDQNVEHYRKIAKGGPGLIIQEGTCVDSEGRMNEGQLGIWDDSQIPGLRRIVNAVHEENCPIVVQIHHGGLRGIFSPLLCPSNYELKTKKETFYGQEMTLSEIHKIRQQFILAAKRAYLAGYDGVELHGCHSYLLCQFLNPNVNRRKDLYGSFDRLISEIVMGIRKETPADFIVGIRLGGFEKTLEEGILHAKAMEALGLDYLNISYGFQGEMAPYSPPDYPFKDIIYAAEMIKKEVSLPVFAVNSITSAEDAENILSQTGVDMVNIGRGVLVNYNWANDAREGKDTGKCLHCKLCKWRGQIPVCPGKVLYENRKIES